jgi:1-deoxy-D-xylulose 5-phosphate reductoisomerase
LAAADEWAVENFIKGKINYTGIAAAVERALEHAPGIACDSLDAVLEANDWTWRYLSR